MWSGLTCLFSPQTNDSKLTKPTLCLQTAPTPYVVHSIECTWFLQLIINVNIIEVARSHWPPWQRPWQTCFSGFSPLQYSSHEWTVFWLQHIIQIKKYMFSSTWCKCSKRQQNKKYASLFWHFAQPTVFYKVKGAFFFSAFQQADYLKYFLPWICLRSIYYQSETLVRFHLPPMDYLTWSEGFWPKLKGDTSVRPQ